MQGTYNFKNVKEQTDDNLLPNGYYKFKIFDIKDMSNSQGDPVVLIRSAVVDCVDESLIDVKISDFIVFPSINSSLKWKQGLTKKFLHSCNLEYDGENIIWNSNDWVNKIYYAFVKQKHNKKYDKLEHEFKYLLEDEYNEKVLPLKTSVNNIDDDMPFLNNETKIPF